MYKKNTSYFVSNIAMLQAFARQITRLRSEQLYIFRVHLHPFNPQLYFKLFTPCPMTFSLLHLTIPVATL